MPDWSEAAKVCQEEAELWTAYGRRNQANGHTDLARLDNAMSAACQNLERKFKTLAQKQEGATETETLRDRIAALEGGIVAENRRVTKKIDALVAAGDALAALASITPITSAEALNSWEKAKDG